MTPDLNAPALWKRASIGETAREAAKAGKKPTLRHLVLDRIREAPAIPETILADLRAEGVRTVLTSIRPRCSELARLGLIRDSGQREKGEGGCKAIVWTACTPDETAAYLAAKASEGEA